MGLEENDDDDYRRNVINRANKELNQMQDNDRGRYNSKFNQDQVADGPQQAAKVPLQSIPPDPDMVKLDDEKREKPAKKGKKKKRNKKNNQEEDVEVLDMDQVYPAGNISGIAGEGQRQMSQIGLKEGIEEVEVYPDNH